MTGIRAEFKRCYGRWLFGLLQWLQNPPHQLRTGALNAVYFTYNILKESRYVYYLNFNHVYIKAY